MLTADADIAVAADALMLLPMLKQVAKIIVLVVYTKRLPFLCFYSTR